MPAACRLVGAGGWHLKFVRGVEAWEDEVKRLVMALGGKIELDDQKGE